MPRKAALSEEFSKVSDELKAMQRPRRPKASWFFVLFMLLLASLCTWLGFWQLQRLAEKEALITSVVERINLEPVAVPPTAEWVGLDPQIYDYRPVTVTGHYLSEPPLFVFTALTDPAGTYEGPGFWVIVPFVSETGGAILVNRGFIPQDSKPLFTDPDSAMAPATGTITLTGIARLPETENAFTPGPDRTNRIDYVRSIERMKQFFPDGLAPVAGFYLDEKAGELGVLPQGGETKLSFPNRHFEYALTWFSFAAITLVMTLFWLWRQRRS